MVLFGKTIIYFNLFVQAFQAMGIQSGIGKKHASYQIIGIWNTEGQPILENNFLNRKKYINTFPICRTIEYRQIGMNSF